MASKEVNFYQIDKFPEVMALKEELEDFYRLVPPIFHVISVNAPLDRYIVATDMVKIYPGKIEGKVEEERNFEYLLDNYDPKLGIIGSYRRIYPEAD